MHLLSMTRSLVISMMVKALLWHPYGYLKEQKRIPFASVLIINTPKGSIVQAFYVHLACYVIGPVFCDIGKGYFRISRPEGSLVSAVDSECTVRSVNVSVQLLHTYVFFNLEKSKNYHL